MNPVFIVKANGDKEAFEPTKLMQSLLRAGATPQTAEQTLHSIEKSLRDGMTTASIYRRAFSLLHKKEKVAALRYSLRTALTELGPSGFPFEIFLSELFKTKGFDVLRDQMVRGACVEHEVDLVATNPEKRLLVEVKFHNERGIKTDVKVALYVGARFEDIVKESHRSGQKEEGWLITNTKFSQSAIEYGMCKGLTLVGWSYPEKGNLREMIQQSGLHPLTCLSTLTRSQKKIFLEKGVVLCRDVLSHPEILDAAGISVEERKSLEEEINALCCTV